MKETDKLRVLLQHWIEHNEEHAADFLRWSEKAGPAASAVREAAERMKAVNLELSSALDLLGGPAEHSHGHEHSHGREH
jgi:hypothetical protein